MLFTVPKSRPELQSQAAAGSLRRRRFGRKRCTLEGSRRTVRGAGLMPVDPACLPSLLPPPARHECFAQRQSAQVYAQLFQQLRSECAPALPDRSRADRCLCRTHAASRVLEPFPNAIKPHVTFKAATVFVIVLVLSIAAVRAFTTLSPDRIAPVSSPERVLHSFFSSSSICLLGSALRSPTR